MRRFYIPETNITDDTAVITGSDVHHLVHVLRKKEGDILEAVDGGGALVTCEIKKIEETMVIVAILKKEDRPGRTIRVKLYQAMPRGSKFDWIVEKTCELGLNELVPVITERTVPRVKEERGLKKLARWERIALETMKQVGRPSTMTIHRVAGFEEISKQLLAFSVKILPWEQEDSKTLRQVVESNPTATDYEIIIGPEGGFSLHEVEQLASFGFQTVTLGSGILKAETAALVTLANLYYEKERG